LKQNLTQAIEQWILEGARAIGQIHIQPLQGGSIELRHIEDVGREALELHEGPSAARPLSALDDKGAYRLLKTAPTLRHGWRLTLANGSELRRALDHFYPAMTAVWFAYLRGELNVLPLRETLGRHTGMYAATKRILDEEGQQAVGATCNAAKCLKRTVWPFAPGQPLDQLPATITTPDIRPVPGGGTEIPMLCQEACNILVPVLREVVKKRERLAEQPPTEPAHGAH
jgi:sirohydrochlorin cobaltochelatase